MKSNNLQYNEKPSSVPNIGNDITGAKRHNFDTYESNEERVLRERKKSEKKSLKTLKSDTLSSLTEDNFAFSLANYEFRRFLVVFEKFDQTVNYSIENMALLKAHVIESKTLVDREIFNCYAKNFNKLARQLSRLKYNVRTLDDAKAYLSPKTKDSFREVNGHEVPWSTDSKSFDAMALAARVNGVQYGNSLSENERIYVSENLIKSIDILDKYLTIDFKSLGFSYGARGRAGSIAHYQDSNKVLAFNRGWDGALIHELGHAIDYALGLVSHGIPYSIRKAYRAKLEKHPILKLKLKYYMNNKEIFARMFEAWVKVTITEATSYMIFLESDASLPDLDAETLAWFNNATKTIVKVEV